MRPACIARSFLRAVLAATSIACVPMVSSAAGGTIRFAGRIVEPPFDIQVSSKPQSASSAASPNGVVIDFQKSQQSANVFVDGRGKTPLVVQCTDGKPITASGCHFGAAGGRVSITRGPGAVASEPSDVLLIVAYN